MALSFQELLRQLVRLKPGGRRAETLRVELTDRLMGIVRAEGLPGVRRLVKQLTSTTPLDPVFATGSVRAWRHTVADRVRRPRAPLVQRRASDTLCRIASMPATTRSGQRERHE